MELGNGHVHQALASTEQKEICMAMLRSEEGVLRLSERVEPITLEFHSDNAKPTRAETNSTVIGVGCDALLAFLIL